MREGLSATSSTDVEHLSTYLVAVLLRRGLHSLAVTIAALEPDIAHQVEKLLVTRTDAQESRILVPLVAKRHGINHAIG